MTTGGEGELERARSELRRLGYLDHGLERFLLQDALRPRRPLRTLGVLALKIGSLGGGVLALALAAALATANGSLASSPLDLPVLFLHLFPPVAAAVGAGFLLLSSAVLLVLRFYPVRRVEAVALAVALAAGATTLLLALWEVRENLAERGTAQRLLLALAAAVAAFAVARLVYQGLFALVVRFTRGAPSEGWRAWHWSRWASGALLAGAALVAVPIVAAARAAEPPPAPVLPVAPGAPVLVLGLDGVLPDEAEYLLRRGDLPAMAGLVGRGGRLLRYVRPDEAPAAFWTSVATGVPAPRHGVAALDSFVPLGTRTPLARSGWLRPYWSRVEVPLHLAEYHPVLSDRRAVFTLWELAARGGAPVLAVNWWATFPAPPLAGIVLAHDAFQLLQQNVAGAVSAPAEAAALRATARSLAAEPPSGTAPELFGARAELFGATPGPPGATLGLPGAGAAAPPLTVGAPAAGALLAAALPAAAAAALERRAMVPDEFYRRVFGDRLARRDPAPRVAALYLPGLDIAAAGWQGSALGFSDLVRDQLVAADRLLARALAQPGWGSVVVVFDPGRRGRPDRPAAGRALLWVAGSSCAAAPDELAPEAIAAGLLRVLGLPQSSELPPPPPACRWPDPPATVATYGARRLDAAGAAGAAAGDEYLRNLRSLGYL